MGTNLEQFAAVYRRHKEERAVVKLGDLGAYRFREEGEQVWDQLIFNARAVRAQTGRLLPYNTNVKMIAKTGNCSPQTVKKRLDAHHFYLAIDPDHRSIHTMNQKGILELKEALPDDIADYYFGAPPYYRALGYADRQRAR